MQGNRLRKMREEARLTQDELAEMADLGVIQINRYENGKTEPNGEIIVRLAKALNVSSDYLLGLSDDPTPAFLSGGLNARERAIVSAVRRGERMKAIRIIADEEAAAG